MLALQPTTNDPAAPKSKRGTTIFMTALVDSGHLSRKNLPFNNFCTTDLRLTSQAFGREPNALPELCNCYAYSTITAPDKGEVTFRVSSTRARAFGIGLSQRCSCDC